MDVALLSTVVRTRGVFGSNHGKPTPVRRRAWDQFTSCPFLVHLMSFTHDLGGGGHVRFIREGLDVVNLLFETDEDTVAYHLKQSFSLKFRFGT